MITGLPLWERYERSVLEVFLLALNLLRGKKLAATVDENDINRALYLCLRAANLGLRKHGRGLESTPTLEAPIQPDPANQERVPQEFKRPDFQCELIDDQAEVCRHYHIECKRLGARPSRGRDLTEEYVSRGVSRFRDDTHRYGHRCCSGAMIGYIQNLGVDDALSLDGILSRVNAANQRLGLSLIALSATRWKPSDVSRLDQSFVRTFAISPFDLRHLWVDMRPL